MNHLYGWLANMVKWHVTGVTIKIQLGVDPLVGYQSFWCEF